MVSLKKKCYPDKFAKVLSLKIHSLPISAPYFSPCKTIYDKKTEKQTLCLTCLNSCLIQDSMGTRWCTNQCKIFFVTCQPYSLLSCACILSGFILLHLYRNSVLLFIQNISLFFCFIPHIIHHITSHC